MKASLVVFLAAAVAAVPQRGLGGGGLPVVSTKTLTPKLRANAKRVAVKYGPFELLAKDDRDQLADAPHRQAKKSPGSMDPKGQSGMSTLSGGLCGGCTVLSAHYGLEYPDGKEAKPESGVYIHHLVSYDTSKQAQSPIGDCNGGSGIKMPFGAQFVDRGEDSGDTATTFASADPSSNSGYHMSAKAKLIVQHDLVNYENTAKKLYIVLDYEYLPGLQGNDAGATLKSVTACGVGGPKVDPKARAVTTGKPMAVTADATVTWARGHLHAGGEKMELFVNGKHTCDSLPKYDAQGVITTMTLCPQPIKLKKGDTVSINAVYNLPKYPLRKSTDGHGAAHGVLGGSDVMGMFAMTYEKA
ncbi:hypothetical protein EJ06DRAFT_523814 [Trichodelitschia bisporula]|uniref:Uncharacterized protein n=1 Tax=Trichodelitschia bisporula TaxID=703511 RepID=A0A6G1HN95_9PEZI|nr:hypothetical protein EJ06DRAFT_523814 [Trichodelitschia bisporula]